MEQLPKIVVQRLQATAKPEVHPDPDLLAGFAERSISEHERAVVMEHLAQCADCREIVALAQPQFELQHVAAAAAMPLPARSSWLRDPIFRWGALAACAAVVAVGAFTLHHQSAARQMAAVKERETAMYDQKVQTYQRQNEMAAKNGPPPSFAINPPEAATASSRRDHALGGIARQQAADESKKTAIGMLTSPNSAPAAAASSSSSSGLVAQAAPPPAPSLDKQEQLLRSEQARVSAAMEPRAVPPASPLPSPPPVALKREEAGAAEAKEIDDRNNNEVKADAIDLSAASTKDSSAARSSQSASPSGNRASSAAGFGGALAGRSAVSLQKVAAVAAPRWTLSSDGLVLLRSLDAGKTWQAVPVASGIVLRAVSALGSEVWVAGSAGVLFHSSSAGREWKKMEPVADGKHLQDDIVAIEFTDAQHGKLTTASHEVWTTSDAGQTWQSSAK